MYNDTFIFCVSVKNINPFNNFHCAFSSFVVLLGDVALSF